MKNNFNHSLNTEPHQNVKKLFRGEERKSTAKKVEFSAKIIWLIIRRRMRNVEKKFRGRVPFWEFHVYYIM